MCLWQTSCLKKNLCALLAVKNSVEDEKKTTTFVTLIIVHTLHHHHIT